MVGNVEKASDLDIIKGSTDILLIAPHGVKEKPRDDKNTAELTRQIANNLECSAIINHIYRKPDDTKNETRNGGRPDLENHYLDLNSVEQAKLHPDFISNIKDMVDKNSPTLVMWIHGAHNKSIEEEAKRFSKYKKVTEKLHALIGYGQGPDRHIKRKVREEDLNDRPTIEPDLAEKIAELLTDNEMNTEPTKRSSKNFCGRSSNNMNQWFILNNYDFSQVQSLQLEIREKGFRTKDSIGNTASIIAGAISALVQSNEHIPAPAKIITPTIVDEHDAKVEEAYEHIKKIIIDTVQKTMLDIGNYLIQQFYGGKHEKVKEIPPSKHKSLKQLFDKLQTETSGNVPKKSWLYNSIRLAVAEKKYKEKKVSIYGKLGHSHKLVLVGQKNLPEKTKIELMENTVHKEWTVLQLQKEVSKIKNGDKLDLSDEFPIERLKKLDVKKLVSLKAKTIERKKKVQNELAVYQENLKNIEKALKPKPKKKKATGFDEWAKIKTNICIGCSNDCKYCYAKYYAVVRFKRIKEDQWANEQIINDNVKMNRTLEKSIIGFPTSHDITQTNIDAYLQVLMKMLVAGNKVLIVSKPNFDCIKKICDNVIQFKDKIIFRFTIGAMDDEILRFWDTNASSYEERKRSLIYAFDNGFQTSVSMEPLLEPSNVIQLATDLVEYVRDYIWIGKMKYTGYFRNKAKKENDLLMTKHIKKIEIWQTDKKIKAIYADVEKRPELLKKIKWKDSYKEVLGIESTTAPGMDI